MRILPNNFDEMLETYMIIAGKAIMRHNIPPQLVINADETNAVFVSRPSRNRAARGVKRIRAQGVGM
jgi:hypothetical protein